jgi:hypothetical protein
MESEERGFHRRGAEIAEVREERFHHRDRDEFLCALCVSVVISCLFSYASN